MPLIFASLSVFHLMFQPYLKTDSSRPLAASLLFPLWLVNARDPVIRRSGYMQFLRLVISFHEAGKGAGKVLK